MLNVMNACRLNKLNNPVVRVKELESLSNVLSFFLIRFLLNIPFRISQ